MIGDLPHAPCETQERAPSPSVEERAAAAAAAAARGDAPMWGAQADSPFGAMSWSDSEAGDAAAPADDVPALLPVTEGQAAGARKEGPGSGLGGAGDALAGGGVQDAPAAEQQRRAADEAGEDRGDLAHLLMAALGSNDVRRRARLAVGRACLLAGGARRAQGQPSCACRAQTPRMAVCAAAQPKRRQSRGSQATGATSNASSSFLMFGQPATAGASRDHSIVPVAELLDSDSRPFGVDPAPAPHAVLRSVRAHDPAGAARRQPPSGGSSPHHGSGRFQPPPDPSYPPLRHAASSASTQARTEAGSAATSRAPSSSVAMLSPRSPMVAAAAPPGFAHDRLPQARFTRKSASTDGGPNTDGASPTHWHGPAAGAGACCSTLDSPRPRPCDFVPRLQKGTAKSPARSSLWALAGQDQGQDFAPLGGKEAADNLRRALGTSSHQQPYLPDASGRQDHWPAPSSPLPSPRQILPMPPLHAVAGHPSLPSPPPPHQHHQHHHLAGGGGAAQAPHPSAQNPPPHLVQAQHARLANRRPRHTLSGAPTGPTSSFGGPPPSASAFGSFRQQQGGMPMSPVQHRHSFVSWQQQQQQQQQQQYMGAAPPRAPSGGHGRRRLTLTGAPTSGGLQGGWGGGGGGGFPLARSGTFAHGAFPPSGHGELPSGMDGMPMALRQAFATGAAGQLVLLAPAASLALRADFEVLSRASPCLQRVVPCMAASSTTTAASTRPTRGARRPTTPACWAALHPCTRCTSTTRSSSSSSSSS